MASSSSVAAAERSHSAGAPRRRPPRLGDFFPTDLSTITAAAAPHSSGSRGPAGALAALVGVGPEGIWMTGADFATPVGAAAAAAAAAAASDAFGLGAVAAAAISGSDFEASPEGGFASPLSESSDGLEGHDQDEGGDGEVRGRSVAWDFQADGISSPPAPREDCQLFVGNLAADVTSEDLIQVFSEFGPVKSVGVAKDSGGRCKGFGFLSFQFPEVAEQVLNSPRLFTLYDRVLRVDWRLRGGGGGGVGGNGNGSFGRSPRQRSAPGGSSPKKQQQQHQPDQQQLLQRRLRPPHPFPTAEDGDYCDEEECDDGGESRQLFVGNLASDVTQADLRQYFKRWGELLYCYVIRDAEGVSKRYGFITFKDPKVGDELMQSRASHVLKGRRLRFEMPKRSREEAFCVKQRGTTTAPPSPNTSVTAAAAAAAAVSTAVPAEDATAAAGLPTDTVGDDRLPVWLHMRLMSDKEQLILCLRKELGLCSLLADKRVREIGQSRDREAQLLRAYAGQLEARLRVQSAELESLREQLATRGELVKQLNAKVESLAVEIVKAWGCATATAAGGAGSDALTFQHHQVTQHYQQQQQQYHHCHHGLRPDSGIGL